MEYITNQYHRKDYGPRMINGDTMIYSNQGNTGSGWEHQPI